MKVVPRRYDSLALLSRSQPDHLLQVVQKGLWPVIGGRLGIVQIPGHGTEPPRASPGAAEHISNIYKDYLLAFDMTYVRSVFEMKAKQSLPPTAGSNGQQQQSPHAQPNPQQAQPQPSRYTPQQMQLMLVHSNVSTATMRARNLPESMVQSVEQDRANIQRTALNQQMMRGHQPVSTSLVAGGQITDPAANAAALRQQQVQQQAQQHQAQQHQAQQQQQHHQQQQRLQEHQQQHAQQQAQQAHQQAQQQQQLLHHQLQQQQSVMSPGRPGQQIPTQGGMPHGLDKSGLLAMGPAKHPGSQVPQARFPPQQATQFINRLKEELKSRPPWPLVPVPPEHQPHFAELAKQMYYFAHALESKLHMSNKPEDAMRPLIYLVRDCY
jgi:hypothetical protein